MGRPGSRLSLLVPEPLVWLLPRHFYDCPEAEQAGSRPGAGSGQPESLEQAGVSVLQRRSGRRGYSLAQPAGTR